MGFGNPIGSLQDGYIVFSYQSYVLAILLSFECLRFFLKNSYDIKCWLYAAQSRVQVKWAAL